MPTGSMQPEVKEHWAVSAPQRRATTLLLSINRSSGSAPRHTAGQQVTISHTTTRSMISPYQGVTFDRRPRSGAGKERLERLSTPMSRLCEEQRGWCQFDDHPMRSYGSCVSVLHDGFDSTYGTGRTGKLLHSMARDRSNSSSTSTPNPA
jgi:hypothetical protein